MIELVQGAEAHLHPRWMDEMHVIRARAFKDRLNWDVEVVGGRERDRFDDCDPLYLLSVNGEGRVQGTLRLLPTTGPNMLRDVFPCLLGEEAPVEHPLIWESSRFVIDLDYCGAHNCGKLVVAELLCGAVEVGLAAGLEFFVSVFDARVKRILETAQYRPEIIGTPRKIGAVQSYAGLFDVDEARWRAVAERAGIAGPVLAAGTKPIERAA